ncbi:MAG: hypothetical protein VX228_06945, partial [Pseudomonadota bacterium]|nr:hypothetical protein [Pseudomonadota bacterium]
CSVLTVTRPLSRLWAGWLGRWQGCSRTPKSTPSSSAADLSGGWAPERRRDVFLTKAIDEANLLGF